MAHKIRGVRVEKYTYYVNKLHQNVGLETWIWRQIMTSQRLPTTNKWPPYATDWNPPWKISAYATAWHSHTTSSGWFLLSSRCCYNFIHLHVLSCKSHDVDFCMWSLSECKSKLWMLQLRIRKRSVFWQLGFDFPQLLNKFCVVLSVFCIFSCKSFSDIAKKYVWA